MRSLPEIRQMIRRAVEAEEGHIEQLKEHQTPQEQAAHISEPSLVAKLQSHEPPLAR